MNIPGSLCEVVGIGAMLLDYMSGSLASVSYAHAPVISQEVCSALIK